MATATELTIDTGATAMEMAEAIFGDGITVQTATYTGAATASGIFSGADTSSPGVAPSDTGVILSTGNVNSFANNSGTTNTNTSTGTSGFNGTAGDADLTALSGSTTSDAAIIEATFLSTGNVLTLDFMFGSEEFPEFFADYNDAIGVWVNGVQATVTIGDGTASVANINGDLTSNLYVDNTADQFNTEMDGFTVTLSFVANVITTGVNTIKIGVADGGDSGYDTNLLIAGDSAQTAIVAQDDSMNMGQNSSKTLDVLDNDSSTIPGALTITHINDVAVSAAPGSPLPNSVTLTTGQIVTINVDGTLTVVSDGDIETVNFVYTMEDTLGNADSAIVTVTQMACFVAGTEVMTPDGPRLIEKLVAGDLVNTRDDGPQPLMWVGRSHCKVSPENRPIRIKAGTLETTKDLVVSPNHRMLITDVWAELLFADNEVLVKAKDLVNDNSIIYDYSSNEVIYFHLLFSEHQLITTHGAVSESYYPGEMTKDAFDADVEDELFRLFPVLASEEFDYGLPARLPLKKYEATALCFYLNL
ncbi:MAG: choice-of-anchor L domain-containing protein [Paracoccaceae bacterium]|nr:choice-of-anchor L domain-containing protein [Paracoccaceae bacterium]